MQEEVKGESTIWPICRENLTDKKTDTKRLRWDNESAVRVTVYSQTPSQPTNMPGGRMTAPQIEGLEFTLVTWECVLCSSEVQT